MRIASAGQVVFAATFVALGILGLIQGDFVPVWAPVPEDVPACDVLIYLTAGISLAAGAGLVVRRTAIPAARVLLGALAIWFVAFRVPVIARAPGSFGAWDSSAETVVIIAGALVLAGGKGVRIGRVLYGVSMIPFGLAHFIFAQETAGLVPSWLPGHLVLAYVTGTAFLAAGLAVLTGVQARLAAALSAVQIGAFTVLVWIPIVAAGSAGAFAWSELGISAALTAAAWVVADSYRTKSQ